MKKTVFKWMLISVVEFIFIFALASIIYKLIFKEADWLRESLFSSISYTFALFIKPFYIEGKLTTSNNIARVITSALCCFIITAFVVGVVLNISTWLSYTMDVVIPFTIGIIIGMSGPLKDDEDKKVEPYNEPNEDKISIDL